MNRDKIFNVFAAIAMIGIAVMILALICRFIVDVHTNMSNTINYAGIIGLILFVGGLAALYVLIAVDSIEYWKSKEG